MLVDPVGEGLNTRQIAERMLAKLGLERRTQAAVLATELRHGRRDPEA